MNSEERLILEKIYSTFSKRFDSLENRFGKLENRFDDIENRFGKLENRFDNIESNFDKLENRFNKLESNFEKLENKFDNLENEVKKNSVLLEKNNKDISIIAEVQENHINQNIKQHSEIINKLESDLDTIKTSIKSISKDLKFIEHKEFQNEKAIFDLKNDIKIIKWKLLIMEKYNIDELEAKVGKIL